MDGRKWGRLFGALVLGVSGALVWAERRGALRKPVDQRAGRPATNLVMAGITTVVTQLAMTPVVRPLMTLVVQRRVGLVRRLPLPEWIREALAIALLDYTLYWWHVLEHRATWLYRFHQVHHADLDLDVTTAARFHFGEFITSVPWRAAQILLIGVTPRTLSHWQRLTMISVLFHHSNVRLPIRFERLLSLFITTPRLHGIHHSIVAEEQNSNWSSGLTIWDRLHGTYRANVPQAEITIGLPAYREPEDVTLPKSLAMPLHELPRWQLPDGTVPKHAPAGVPRDRLLS
jgi:sterol desaturase/sphingolipid hydroxylase (fatty acid hydroxylase superfamily)